MLENRRRTMYFSYEDDKERLVLVDPLVRTDAKKAVTKGAEWLDKNYPGWSERVDHGTLDMGAGSS